MKLYITPGSPYARMVRIFILEKGLQDRIGIVAAQTRLAGSPYYAINPSGRVPYLVRDDVVGMEESALIVDYLDRLDGQPMLSIPNGEAGWEARRLEALARSLLDGLAVWGRENSRAPDERSTTTINHETARSVRMAELWESLIDHAWMNGPINMAQITLGCALGYEVRLADWRWRAGHPKLVTWFERFAARPSFAATVP